MSRTYAVLALMLAGCLLTAGGGCYQNTVGARGYGAERAPISQANVPSRTEKISGYRKIEHKQLD